MTTMLKSRIFFAEDAGILSEELDEAIIALTAFDLVRLETMERRVSTMTAAHLANRWELLPEIVEKHALLRQLLTMTAANLKVLASVLHSEPRMEMR